MVLLSSQLSLCGLFVLLLQSSLSGASPLLLENLDKRNALSYCNNFDIVVIDKILSKYSQPASSICSQVLHIPAPTPTTVTTTAVTYTVVNTAINHVTFTATSGLATTSTATTTTSTSTSVTTAFSTATSVQIVLTTSVIAQQAITVITAPTTTTTVTVYSASPLMRRANPRTLGDVAPGSPLELRFIALGIASQACSCFVMTKPALTHLVTATMTVTAMSNVVATDTTVVKPSGTTTVVSTVVIGTTMVTTTTDVVSTTVQSTLTVLTTSVSTLTSTAPGPTSTVVVPIQVTYTQEQKKVGYPSCAYNRYYKAVPNVSGDPGPNNDFAVGLAQCEAACTANPSCKFFYYDAYDPAHTNGGFAGGECDLDNQPYDPSLVQCDLPTRFGVGYQKN